GVASAKVPRRHIIHDHAPAIQGLVSILGGKLSTFRSLAEETVDLVLARLGKRQVACRTASALLPGGRAIEPGSVQDPVLAQRSAARLDAIYGSRARDVLQL